MTTENFDWIQNVPIKTAIATTLVKCCIEINPKWTPELDAAARIVLFAANGGLAHRKYNEMYLSEITTLFEQENLCNSHIIDIAIDIIENPYFHASGSANIGINIDSKHIKLVQKFSAKWHQDRWAQT